MPRNGTANLTPLTERSIEEQKKIRSAAGIASGKARRNKKMLKDCLEVLLEKKMKNPDDPNKNITGAEALSVTLFQKALMGDDKAWELLRDTVGQKPVDKIEQTNTNIEIDLSDFDED